MGLWMGKDDRWRRKRESDGGTAGGGGRIMNTCPVSSGASRSARPLIVRNVTIKATTHDRAPMDHVNSSRLLIYQFIMSLMATALGTSTSAASPPSDDLSAMPPARPRSLQTAVPTPHCRPKVRLGVSGRP